MTVLVQCPFCGCYVPHENRDAHESQCAEVNGLEREAEEERNR